MFKSVVQVIAEVSTVHGICDVNGTLTDQLVKFLL